MHEPKRINCDQLSSLLAFIVSTVYTKKRFVCKYFVHHIYSFQDKASNTRITSIPQEVVFFIANIDALIKFVSTNYLLSLITDKVHLH